MTELETGEASTIFTESNNLTLYSLQPFTTYGFLVSAQTVAGRGPTTRLLSVTTLEEGLAIITSTTRNVKSISRIISSNYVIQFCVCVTLFFFFYIFKLFIYLLNYSSHWRANKCNCAFHWTNQYPHQLGSSSRRHFVWNDQRVPDYLY